MFFALKHVKRFFNGLVMAAVAVDVLVVVAVAARCLPCCNLRSRRFASSLKYSWESLRSRGAVPEPLDH